MLKSSLLRTARATARSASRVQPPVAAIFLARRFSTTKVQREEATAEALNSAEPELQAHFGESRDLLLNVRCFILPSLSPRSSSFDYTSSLLPLTFSSLQSNNSRRLAREPSPSQLDVMLLESQRYFWTSSTCHQCQEVRQCQSRSWSTCD
jgi:hypothetical protein